MTEFEAQFKKKIYEPYNEAWAIMKSLRKADLTKQSTWDDYKAKCDAFLKTHNSELGGSIYRVMLDAGSEVGRIDRACKA